MPPYRMPAPEIAPRDAGVARKRSLISGFLRNLEVVLRYLSEMSGEWEHESGGMARASPFLSAGVMLVVIRCGSSVLRGYAALTQEGFTRYTETVGGWGNRVVRIFLRPVMQSCPLLPEAGAVVLTPLQRRTRSRA